MILYFCIFLVGIIFLFSLNNLQKKYKFCLDTITLDEPHKKLLKLNKNVPLSGNYFFIIPVILILLSLSIEAMLICMLFFIIGLFSDIKILSSPKKRFLLQYLALIIFIYLNKDLIIDTKINLINDFINHPIYRILIVSFFFLVLINGFNFIDGVNNLCSFNLLLIFIFLYFVFFKINLIFLSDKILIIIILMFVFVIFNFFGNNFLGDGAVYGLSFLVGFLCIKASNFSDTFSPYFYSNLLWYPAFENLFSIIRRSLNKKKNYLADNLHLHHLIYKMLDNKLLIKKKYIVSSLTGLIINFYLLIIYIISYFYHSKTNIQIIITLFSITVYLISYFYLKKINKKI